MSCSLTHYTFHFIHGNVMYFSTFNTISIYHYHTLHYHHAIHYHHLFTPSPPQRTISFYHYLTFLFTPSHLLTLSHFLTPSLHPTCSHYHTSHSLHPTSSTITSPHLLTLSHLTLTSHLTLSLHHTSHPSQSHCQSSPTLMSAGTASPVTMAIPPYSLSPLPPLNTSVAATTHGRRLFTVYPSNLYCTGSIPDGPLSYCGSRSPQDTQGAGWGPGGTRGCGQCPETVCLLPPLHHHNSKPCPHRCHPSPLPLTPTHS